MIAGAVSLVGQGRAQHEMIVNAIQEAASLASGQGFANHPH